MDNEVLVKVEGVAKKFCRDLKEISLWYGVKDISSELFGASKNGQLRPKEFWAVDDVSFELRRGECLGLIGHNGAGKSTLLKMLNGLIKPDKGKITMKGRIGALIELGAGFNPILTGRENIYNNGAVLGFSRKEIDAKFDAIVDFAEIDDFIDTPVQNYSSGMKVRLGFAVAAQMEPDVLLIDEVLAVGDIGFRIKCLNKLGELLQNSAVIFVSHTMPQIARICSKVMMLDRGRSIVYTEDVSVAISKYYNRFSSEKENLVNNANIKLISFKINSINSTSNQDTCSVYFGEDIHLEIELEIPESNLLLTSKIFFINQEMRTVLDVPSELLNEPFQINSNRLKIVVRIPDIQLNTGKYGLSLILLNGQTGERLYRHDNITFVNIISKYVSWSDNISKSRWEIINCK
jgi:lipopolysaccharide transport system ATP-binding protein